MNSIWLKYRLGIFTAVKDADATHVLLFLHGEEPAPFQFVQLVEGDGVEDAFDALRNAACNAGGYVLFDPQSGLTGAVLPNTFDAALAFFTTPKTAFFGWLPFPCRLVEIVERTAVPVVVNGGDV